MVHALFLKSNMMKSGAPIRAVIMPTGSSPDEGSILAKRSQKIRYEAPPSRHDGTSNR
jgi:hypothetical protein